MGKRKLRFDLCERNKQPRCRRVQPEPQILQPLIVSLPLVSYTSSSVPNLDVLFMRLNKIGTCIPQGWTTSNSL